MKKIFLAVIIIAIAGSLYYFRDTLSAMFSDGGSETIRTSGATAEDIEAISGYSYTESYTNSDYGLAFRYPDDFQVSLMPSGESGEAILVFNPAKNIGVQILISPFAGADIDLNPDIIRSNIPDMRIDEAQELLVGNNRKGVAFKSDNEDFGGASREVWFVYKGNLYQISTYVELDPFLRGLFATWQFQQ